MKTCWRATRPGKEEPEADPRPDGNRRGHRTASRPGPWNPYTPVEEQMKRTTRLLIGMLFVLATLLALAGCGKAPEAQKLTIWINGRDSFIGPSEQQLPQEEWYISQAIKRFEDGQSRRDGRAGRPVGRVCGASDVPHRGAGRQCPGHRQPVGRTVHLRPLGRHHPDHRQDPSRRPGEDPGLGDRYRRLHRGQPDPRLPDPRQPAVLLPVQQADRGRGRAGFRGQSAADDG